MEFNNKDGLHPSNFFAMLFVAGDFYHLSALDLQTLELRFNVPTPSQFNNCRVIPIPTFPDTDNLIVAVSENPSFLGKFSQSSISLIDVKLGTVRLVLRSNRTPIYGLECLSPLLANSTSSPLFGSCCRLVAGDRNGSVHVFECGNQGKNLFSLQNVPKYTHRIRSFDGMNVYVAAGDLWRGSLMHYDLGERSHPQRPVRDFLERVHDGDCYDVASDSARRMLFSLSYRQNLRCWSTDSRIELQSLRLTEGARCLSLAEEGTGNSNVLVIGTVNGRIQVRDVRQMGVSVREFNAVRSTIFDMVQIPTRVGEENQLPFVAVSTSKRSHNAVRFDIRTGKVGCMARLAGGCRGCCVVASGSGCESIHEEEEWIRVLFGFEFASEEKTGLKTMIVFCDERTLFVPVAVFLHH